MLKIWRMADVFRTGVDTFLVPATREEAVFVSRAALWDVRNEFLYMTAESESVQGQRRPLALIDRKEVIDDARKDSLGQLIQEVSKRMSSLAAGHVAPAGEIRPARATPDSHP
jgi:hypothetical protein